MYVMMENDLRFADIQICIKDQPTNGAVKLDLENNVVYIYPGKDDDFDSREMLSEDII